MLYGQISASGLGLGAEVFEVKGSRGGFLNSSDIFFISEIRFCFVIHFIQAL